MMENVLYGALFGAVEQLGMGIIAVYLVAVILLLLIFHFTVGKFFDLLGFFRLRITTVVLVCLMGLSLVSYLQALDPSVQEGFSLKAVGQGEWIPFGAYGVGRAFIEAMRPLHSQIQDVCSGTVLCLVYNFSFGLTFLVMGWIIFALLVGWYFLIPALAGDLFLNWKQGKWTRRSEREEEKADQEDEAHEAHEEKHVEEG